MTYARNLIDQARHTLGPVKSFYSDAMLDRLGPLDAHELVELRELLAERIQAIDARIRELDGRNTAGAETLRRAR